MGDAIIGAGAPDRPIPSSPSSASGIAPERIRVAARRHRRNLLRPRHRRPRARSRFGGASLIQAADKLIAKGRRNCRASLRGSRGPMSYLPTGVFAVSGTDRPSRHRRGGAGCVQPGAARRRGVEAGFAETGNYTPPQPTFPNGCHVLRGRDRARDRACRDRTLSCGRRFSAQSSTRCCFGAKCRGGDRAKGSARRCSNAPSSIRKSGQLLTGSLIDYCLPRAEDLPAIEFAYNVVPCRTQSTRRQGCRRSGAPSAPPPALVNAVVDALAELGIEHLDMPLTPERLWQAIHAAEQRVAAVEHRPSGNAGTSYAGRRSSPARRSSRIYAEGIRRSPQKPTRPR